MTSTLSQSVTAPTQPQSSFNFVSVGAFSASPFSNVTTGGSSTTFTLLDKPAGTLEVGMTITGEGIPAGAKITEVEGSHVAFVTKPQPVIETRSEVRLDAGRIERAVWAQLRGHGLVFRPDGRQ